MIDGSGIGHRTRKLDYQWRANSALGRERLEHPAGRHAGLGPPGSGLDIGVPQTAVFQTVVKRIQVGKPDKTVDIRPFLEHVTFHDDTLTVKAVITPGGTLRPNEVLDVAGLEPVPGMVVARVKIDGSG